jgi:hypothetical protein
MPRLRLTIGNGEQMEPAVIEATPLGLLGTEAVVRIGAAEIRGSAKALRRLAVAAGEAADLADAHDRERGGF